MWFFWATGHRYLLETEAFGGGSQARVVEDSDAALAVVEQLDANDLTEILLVEKIGGRMIGDGYKETHAFAIGHAPSKKVESVARDIPGGANFLERFGAGIGRTQP
ncbi:MAG: hypothetical protein NVS9B13_01100 [Candidatus Acidiferrum sp.]